MVILHVKKGDQNLFLFETKTNVIIEDILKNLVNIQNGRLKIERLCDEIEKLAKHGVCLPPNMQGLSNEQISELKLKDEWAEKNLISTNYFVNPDPIGIRNGLAPTEKYADILTKTTAEAKERISQKLIDKKVFVTSPEIENTLDILKGAVRIVYPMGLPSYDPVYQELEETRNLSEMQASKDILDPNSTDLWWASKQLEADKFLSDYVGKNEKSKLIVKLQKKGHGAPAREPVLSEEQRKELMLAEFHRREELKKLEEDESDSHLDSEWADPNYMRRNIMGLKNIKFK